MFKKEEKVPFYEDREFWKTVIIVGSVIGLFFLLFNEDEKPKEKDTKDKLKKKYKRSKKMLGLKLLFS